MNSDETDSLAALRKTKCVAEERTIELALGDEAPARIPGLLRDEGYGGLLEQSEVEALVAKARMIQKMIPERPGTFFPRLIGMVAVLVGIGGMILGASGPWLSRCSPAGYGVNAAVLGIILIVRPWWGRSEIR